MIPTTIFVEGPSDEKFVQDFIQKHFNIKLEIRTDIQSFKGKDNWTNTYKYFQKSTMSGKTNLLIFDADSNPEDRRKEIESKKGEFDIDFQLFLFPNDRDPGELEKILERIAFNHSEAIFNCFNNYKDCIESLDKTYTKPDLKTKIYAYSEVVTGIGKDDKRNYTDESVWNMKDDYLNPLVEFLKPYYGI